MKLLPIFPLVLFLASCVPGTSVVSPPSFSLVSDASGLVRLEPPGVGTGAAVIRLELEAHNPNPFGLQLAGVDGDLFLADQRVAASRFARGVSLPPGGTARLALDVEAPLAEAPHLLGQMARLVAGEAVPYRLDGTVAVDAFGTTQRFPSVTVARGELRPPDLRAPEVRFDAGASEVRLEGLTAHVEIGLVIDNPSPLGFYARGPEFELRLDGRTIGRASLQETPVQALGPTTASLRLEAGIAQLGAALLTRLQGGGTELQVALAGDVVFEIPGVATTSRTLSGLAGTLR